jgi:hypothetical protein
VAVAEGVQIVSALVCVGRAKRDDDATVRRRRYQHDLGIGGILQDWNARKVTKQFSLLKHLRLDFAARVLGRNDLHCRRIAFTIRCW